MTNPLTYIGSYTELPTGKNGDVCSVNGELYVWSGGCWFEIDIFEQEKESPYILNRCLYI